MSRALSSSFFALTALLAGCASSPRAAPPKTPSHVGAEAGSDGRASYSLEEEEASLEGLGADEMPGDPIGAFISALNGALSEGAPAADTGVSQGGEAESGSQAPVATSGRTALDLWNMSDDECRAYLAGAGIAVSAPDFETPFVRQPLLLDGPIDGVTIRPKWRRDVRVNEVMDCRLIAALRDTAALARAHGFSEILFYSTYRPVQEPPAECPSGRPGKKCRAAHDAWEKAKAGRASMHRRGLAIDIGWLSAADGRAVSVLDDYEKRAGAPPCETRAETALGRDLRDFACGLHEVKTFNVVLTPNANKAHENHFHFDITPGARWYIVR